MKEEKLLKYAVEYLSKYDSSKNNLINVLKRKIFRLKVDSVEKNNLMSSINRIIQKLENANLLDDNKYTLSKIASLSSSAKSKSFIFNYLIKKGINKFDVENNFEIFKASNCDWELNSAKLFVRKKNLNSSNKSYEKKLAKMARAGFKYEICKKVLD